MSFQGKVAFVTGGGTGIGKATATAFAREGAAVLVMGPDEAQLRSTVKEIEERDGRAGLVVGDVTVEDDVRRAIEKVAGEYGALDIAFNNAGIMVPGAIADIDRDTWEKGLSVATGTWLSMKHEIAYMREHGGGAIVNMSSIIGNHRSIPGTGAYGAAKAAIRAITRVAAIENIKAGIRINSVSPGPIATPFSLIRGESEAEQANRMKSVLPIGRIGSVDEAVAAVLWLASDKSGFAVGADIVIDGGSTA